jgi:sulfur transfer protein SufE
MTGLNLKHLKRWNQALKQLISKAKDLNKLEKKERNGKL